MQSRYRLLLLIIVLFAGPLVGSCFADDAPERIHNWIERLWEERGGVRGFVARAVATGRIPFLGADLDGDAVQELSRLADTGLVGLDEMNRVQEILLEEFARREGGRPTVSGLMAILDEAALDEIALDEVILRIVVPQSLATPEDLAAIFARLSGPTKRLGADYVRELLVSRLRGVRGRMMDEDEIPVAFPKRGLHRDGLLLARAITRWADGTLGSLRNLLSDAFGRHADRLTTSVSPATRVLAFFGDSPAPRPRSPARDGPSSSAFARACTTTSSSIATPPSPSSTSGLP